MTHRSLLALALVTAVTTGAARADDEFWGRAAKPEKQSRRDEVIADAHELLRETMLRARLELQHNSFQLPRRWGPFVEDYARRALATYEQAIALGDDVELRFRALTAASFLDLDEGWEAIVLHTDGFRAADPNDPREIQVTWDVAQALSHLGMAGGPKADERFARAIAEYDRWRAMLDEASPFASKNTAISYVNSAELFMAMGRLEEALEYYQEGRDLDTGEALAFYGLAVAYDRDGQWQNAKQAMTEALVRDNAPFLARLEAPSVFFVPDGDIHYYKALGYHVLGKKQEAIQEYREFLDRCTDTRYAGRARQHLQELGAEEVVDP